MSADYWAFPSGQLDGSNLFASVPTGDYYENTYPRSDSLLFDVRDSCRSLNSLLTKANLITNGGFETGDFTGWNVAGSSSVEGKAFGIPPHSGDFYGAFFPWCSIRPLRQPGASCPLPLRLLAHERSNIFGLVQRQLGGITIINRDVTRLFDYTRFTFNVCDRLRISPRNCCSNLIQDLAPFIWTTSA